MNYKRESKVEKPWGYYQTLDEGPNYWIKKLFVKKDARLSLQSHKERSEIWFVLSGEIIAQKGEQKKNLKTGDMIEIDKNEKHRITGVSEAVVFELALGNPEEDDIVRYEDDYKRV